MFRRRGPRARVTHTRKLALSVALVVVAAGVVGLGAFATFTGTATTSPAFSSGTVSLAPIGTSGANNRLSIGAAGLAAGDTVQRAVDLKNTGTLSISAPTLTTSATVSSLLDTDATNGLQLTINKCSVAWTEGGTAPAYTYTCGGTTTAVLASVPVVGSSLALSNITTTANTDNFLVATLTLPSGSPNTEQNQSSTILFTFTANQRAAQAQ